MVPPSRVDQTTWFPSCLFLNTPRHVYTMRNNIYMQGGSEDEDISALDEEEFREIFDTTNQIPGNYRDAMNNKTELGAAIRDACSELDALGSLEQNLLQEAEGLLKQVGYKGSLFEQPNKDEGSSSSSSSSSS